MPFVLMFILVADDTARTPSAELVDKAAQLGDSWKALHVQISKFGKLFEKVSLAPVKE